ncbi:hypothetical protein OQA88_2633 [Cercophora sp. LCS_1]
MPRVGHGQSSVFFANMDSSDDNQRNINQSEVDQFAKTTGKNLKGYLPSISPCTPFIEIVLRRRLTPQKDPDEASRGHQEGSHPCGMSIPQTSRRTDNSALQATLHGNTPNKGAMTDKELMEDDEATLKRMEEKKERKRAGLGSGERSMSG